MDLHPGLRVNPNVCLVGQLGEGGMGSVWLADHTSLHTRVAVKFISAELVKTDPSLVERFKREAALCAQIKSPHVVQTFDHGVMADGRPYIVMELLEGESLQARLERAGALSIAETRSVVTQACKALGKAHRLGIVHRDIKPDNLFLTPDEDEPFLLKVLDFGIAKQTGLPQSSKMTSTGSMVGTPEYMSPEQVLSSTSVDHRSDLWAVAVVAYHCLTGRVPFQGETLGSLCVAIANARFDAPRERRPDLPSAVDRWFERALALDPNHRFDSAKELAQSFWAALSPSGLADDFTIGDGTAALDDGPASVGGPRHVVRVEMPTLKGNAPSPTALATSRTSISSPSLTPPGVTSARLPTVTKTATASARTIALVAFATLAMAGAAAYFVTASPPPSSESSASAEPIAPPAVATTAMSAAPSPIATGSTPAGPVPSAGAPHASATTPPTATPTATARPTRPTGASTGIHQAVDRGF